MSRMLFRSVAMFAVLIGFHASAHAQTYWIGRKDAAQKKLVFDVQVPAFFVPFIKEQTPLGAGTPITRTINGNSYTFYKQYFAWHEGSGKSSPRGEYQQIRIDNNPERGLSNMWKNCAPNFKSNKTFTDALYSVATGTDWMSADVLFVETAGTTAPKLAIAPGALEGGTPFELGKAELVQVVGEGTIHERCPQYISFPNNDGSIDVVWQDIAGKKISVHRLNTTAKTSSLIASVDSLGLLAGAAKSTTGTYFVATAERWTDANQNKQIKIVSVAAGQAPKTLWTASVQAPLQGGSARLALAESSNKLLAVFNLVNTHSHYVLISSQAENQTTLPHETLWHHNFDQRLIFDGSDFVIMEKRDHDVTVTLMKVSPSETSPQKDGNWQDKVRSVYTTTNWGNGTYTELGHIVPGLDGGYLVLFSSERDWDRKFSGNPNAASTKKFAPHWGVRTSSQPIPPGYGSPRDLAAVHVVGDFDRQDANWRDVGGKWYSQSPKLVDTSALVNSAGSGKSVLYETANDGWEWYSYSGNKTPGDLAKLAVEQGLTADKWNDTVRELTTSGVKWFTNYGEAAEKAEKLISDGTPFTTVERPKLVKVGNQCVALWEEQTCKSQQGGEWYPSSLNYVQTKAMTITLSKDAQGKVQITPSAPATLAGNPRLHWHDDAFAWNNKAAWITGDSVNRTLVVHSVAPGSNAYTSVAVTLP